MHRSAVLGLFLAALAALAGCSDDDARPPGMNGPGGGSPTLPSGGDPCATPAPRCPSSDVGATAACVVKRVSGSYVSCSEGRMECGADGAWSACEGAATVWQKPPPSAASVD